MRSRTVTLVVLLAAVGCQSPPARPAACGSDAASRNVLMVRQVARDSAASVAARPGRAVRAAVTESVVVAHARAVGLVEKRVALNLLGSPPPVCPDRPPLDVCKLEADAGGGPGTPTDMRLYTDGEGAMAALDEVIDGARCRLDVLMYLWADDAVGWRVARRLAAKAGPDLPVRVLVDGGGNLTLGQPKGASAAEVNRAVCWLAAQPHVTLVRTRNPGFRFDHRKLVAADGRIAWTGGRNFTAPAFDADRDLSYTVGGPLAADLAGRFEEFWREQGGTPAEAPTATPAEAPTATARVVVTDPAERSMARAVYAAVGRAERRVYAENLYLSDPHFVYLLAKARHRGADVRVVLTLHSDSDLYDRANKVTANRLLKAGVRVYLYPTKTHVKAVTVDGVWAYTGTGNFDPLSLRHNREMGLVVSAGPVIGELEERVFEADFRPEWELTEPLPLSPLDYLYEFFAATFA